MNLSAVDLILEHSVNESESVPAGAVDFTSELYCQLPRNYVRRMPNNSGSRFYFTWEGEDLRYGCGLSGFAKDMANGYFLDKWKQKKGLEADEIMRNAGDYGTFIHVAYSVIATNYANGVGFAVNNSLYSALKEYMKERGTPMSLYSNWSSRLGRDIASFVHFLLTYKVEILACEYPVFDWDLRVSTPIDLVFSYENSRGKRVVAAMNFKTRESSSVFESDQYQIPAEALLLNKNLPDLGVTESFVWIPRTAKRATTEPFIMKNMMAAKHKRLGNKPYTWTDFVQDWEFQRDRGPSWYAYQVDLDAPVDNMGLFTFDPKEGITHEGMTTLKEYCERFKPEEDED
jgi:hypothetical protein